MNDRQWTCTLSVLAPDLERLRKLAVAVSRADGQFSAAHSTASHIWQIEVEGPLALREIMEAYASQEAVLEDMSPKCR